MDDTKTIDKDNYPVTIGGVEYEFARPDPKLIERMILISHMNADQYVTLEACTKWLSVAAGTETWSKLMRRFLNGDIDAQDLLTAIKDLTDAMVAKELARDAA